MTDETTVFDDLAADSAELTGLVAGLTPAGWAELTPAPGWTIRHQVAHLCAVFRMAATAAASPQAFRDAMAHLGPDFDANVSAALERFLDEPGALLSRWRVESAAAVQALAAVPAGSVVPWLVRPLPARVLAAAGMMEVFAHGQDIADALGVTRRHTDRLRHIAEFAALTWDFGYHARGLLVPAAGPRFDLLAPSGERWVIGADDAETITGDAVDLCLLVTRRRHRDDLGLVASGPLAEHWLSVAQAYRGPAGAGRRPGQFAATAGR
ncbi:TIGR03084 family metal-binding protein [Actinoplanes sp. NPDC049599]|uniref:TIGR03084 family metal-binding protein n=1 Tax=Actinoplanes sp. NPDC049599 TaxID=3363903 RepID=UPI003799FE82